MNNNDNSTTCPHLFKGTTTQTDLLTDESQFSLLEEDGLKQVFFLQFESLSEITYKQGHKNIRFIRGILSFHSVVMQKVSILI